MSLYIITRRLLILIHHIYTHKQHQSAKERVHAFLMNYTFNKSLDS